VREDERHKLGVLLAEERGQDIAIIQGKKSEGAVPCGLLHRGNRLLVR
jgi:hypothetical protein